MADLNTNNNKPLNPKPPADNPPQTRDETIAQAQNAAAIRAGAPGEGPGATIDPQLGGPKGGPGQFAGNPPGPLGSDNPDLPRRDQIGDSTPGTFQPNPQNPVPLPPRQVAEERAARDREIMDRQVADRDNANRKASDEANAPKPDFDKSRAKR